MKCEEVIDCVVSKHDLKALIKSVSKGDENFNKEVLKERVSNLIRRKRIQDLFQNIPEQYVNIREIMGKEQKLKNLSLRDIVIVSDMIMEVLLNSIDYFKEKNELFNEILNNEKTIVEEAEKYKIQKQECSECHRISDAKKYSLLFKLAKKDDDISPDEFTIFREAVNEGVFELSKREKWYIETQYEFFPQKGKKLHTPTNISDIIYCYLRNCGIVFPIIHAKYGEKGFIIPEEIAEDLREIYDIDLQKDNMKKMLEDSSLYNKKVLKQICDNFNLVGKTLDDSVELIATHNISAKELLTFLSQKDEASFNELANKYGAEKLKFKGDKINRIIKEFDKNLTLPPPPHPWRYLFEYYTELASQNTQKLIQEKIIDRSEQIGKNFERATYYIFEEIFKNKVIAQKGKGKNSPDIEIRYGNNYCIIGDCKTSLLKPSKKTNHIQYENQFLNYINNYKENTVLNLRAFLLLSPDFNETSVKLIESLKLKTGIDVCIITAKEFKEFAEFWFIRNKDKSLNPDVFVFKGELKCEELINKAEMVEHIDY